MINKLSIQNYKSIKVLDLKPSRVNVFIGEHNSGKSNILEALSWFSVNALGSDAFREMFRFKTATDLFYDFDATKPIAITTSDLSTNIRYAKNKYGALLDHFEVLIHSKKTGIDLKKTEFHELKGNIGGYTAFELSFDGGISNSKGSIQTPFRTYIFKKLISFQNTFSPFLSPPFGENIPSLLISNKEYKDRISGLFKSKGFRLMLKPTEGDMSMAKDVNDELYAYPYPVISETLQRIVFYMLAIESNKNAILVMDEPESNTFPMYTKQLAEIMAFDTFNQYFIATHNPYLLDSLVSKTPLNQLSVFVTKMEKYQTSAKKVSNKKLSELLDKGVDFYFNLDKLTEK